MADGLTDRQKLAKIGWWWGMRVSVITAAILAAKYSWLLIMKVV